MNDLQGTVSVEQILAYLDRDAYIGLPGLCRYLAVEERTARGLVKQGLPCYRVNHKLLRFKRSEVDKWMQTFRQAPGDAGKKALDQMVSELMVKAARTRRPVGLGGPSATTKTPGESKVKTQY